MASKKVRATVDDKPELGKTRYKIFKSGWQRINQALAEGYYVEAIALIESFLADRLESRLGELRKQPQGFSTVGKLASKLKSQEQDRDLKRLADQTSAWAGDRNEIVHQMVKIERGCNKNWETRYAKAKSVAEDGKTILRKYDSRLKKVRKNG